MTAADSTPDKSVDPSDSSAPGGLSTPGNGTATARFFARVFDIWWESTALGLVISWFLSSNSNAFAEWTTGPGNGALFGLLCLPIVMILDAGIYDALGNTPGKALLRLKVTTADGRKLSYSEYSRRNLNVWARGFGCGVPLVNLIAMWRQQKELSSVGHASYDAATQHRVTAGKTGIVRTALFGFLLISVVSLGLQVQRARSMQGASIGSGIPRSEVYGSHNLPVKWTNPYTGQATTVDGVWKVSKETTPHNETVYSFAEEGNRAVVFFAVDENSEMSMARYARGYLAATSSAMDLSTPSPVNQATVVETWTANGHVKSSPNLTAHVELRHVGRSFWRMVAIQPQSNGMDDAVESLRDALWSTVSNI